MGLAEIESDVDDLPDRGKSRRRHCGQVLTGVVQVQDVFRPKVFNVGHFCGSAIRAGTTIDAYVMRSNRQESNAFEADSAP